MSSSASNSPPDAAMNVADSISVTQNGRHGHLSGMVGDNTNVPKPKRLACMICRKRKLKCDGVKPSCSTCTRLGHSCAYDEVRRKSGPKRGYVKALEERLSMLMLFFHVPVSCTPFISSLPCALHVRLVSLLSCETFARYERSADTNPKNLVVSLLLCPASLEQVETLLKTQDHPPVPAADAPANRVSPAVGGGLTNGGKRTDSGAAGAAAAAATANFDITDPSISIANSRDMDRWHFTPESPRQPGSLDDFNFNSNIAIGMNNVDNNFTWEMIGLGLEEPLPPQETIDELHQIYFEKIHPSIPMIHKYRYLAAMNLAPNQRPPVCLRYAMWTLACTITDKYGDLKDLFYQRARKYVEADYVKGYGEHIICTAHTQTHILLASYELKMMYFPRAWMSTGSAVRLAQMIGLHRLDGTGLDVKQCLPPPRDWTEREERRRTFWMAFAMDRYASIGTGWPMSIDEKDIMTNLPAPDDAFEMSRPEQTVSLSEAMCPAGAAKLSSFGGIVLMACLFGRNLIHLHRPDDDDRDHDLNGEFWKRHRTMDNILLNTSLCLPPHLKLPQGLQNPNVVYTNMCIHTSTICLHQAAIFKADKNRLPASVSAESKVRCITAANEIASIMKMVSHMDLSAMNPFLAFCLYVSARVFVQYLKSRPEDSQSADSLRFLLTAMNALKRKNPLTESFLVQLDVDLEALVARIPNLKGAFPPSGDSPIPGNLNASGVRNGAPCEEGPNNGIFTYRNECHFMKTGGDDGNPATAPDLSEGDGGRDNLQTNSGSSANSRAVGSVSASVSGSGSGVATWLMADTRLPTRERSSGPSSSSGGYSIPVVNLTPNSHTILGNGGGGFGHQSESGETGDMSTSPNGGDPSNQPTPSSSTAGGNGNTGGNSYETSPVSPHQNLTGGELDQQQQQQQQQQHQQQQQRNVGMGAFFNPGPHGYTINSAASEFNIAPNWGISDESGMVPVTEGVLRTIMQMDPMETMDLGWDSNL